MIGQVYCVVEIINITINIRMLKYSGTQLFVKILTTMKYIYIIILLIPVYTDWPNELFCIIEINKFYTLIFLIK